MNVIIRMLAAYEPKSFLTKVQERIFFVRFVILVPRQNEYIFTSKSKIFKFKTPNSAKISMTPLPQPPHNINHALGDSNIQGYHFRTHTFRESFENVIVVCHSEKNTKIVKKNSHLFLRPKIKILTRTKVSLTYSLQLHRVRILIFGLKKKWEFFLTNFNFWQKYRKWPKKCPSNMIHTSKSHDNYSSSPWRYVMTFGNIVGALLSHIYVNLSRQVLFWHFDEFPIVNYRIFF